MDIGSKPLLCAAIGSLLCASPVSGRNDGVRPVGRAATFDGTLSVLTYNVAGLPWPIASGRSAAIDAMASRLRDLRRQGRNPHLVVLQEAFTDDARAIGRAAGYRYVVDGPSVAEVNEATGNAEDRRFVADASWWSGETQGKLYGSGLQLLSDFPVIRVRRMAYPAFACAGYDCLANKGALLATVRVPGAPSPVDIVTTHLNSRKSTGVSDARSLYAYRRQAALLSAFLNEQHDPAHPLIVAGDFNTGSARLRRAALRAQIATWPGADAFQNALEQVAEPRMAAGMPLPRDVGAALRRATDWQFFASGTNARLRVVAVSVPFGREATGGMLSDHIGYTAMFRLDRRAR